MSVTHPDLCAESPRKTYLLDKSAIPGSISLRPLVCGGRNIPEKELPLESWGPIQRLVSCEVDQFAMKVVDCLIFDEPESLSCPIDLDSAFTTQFLSDITAPQANRSEMGTYSQPCCPASSRNTCDFCSFDRLE